MITRTGPWSRFICRVSVKFATKHFLIFGERQGTTKMLSYFTMAVFIFNSSPSLSKNNSRTLDLIAPVLSSQGQCTECFNWLAAHSNDVIWVKRTMISGECSRDHDYLVSTPTVAAIQNAAPLKQNGDHHHHPNRN